MTNLLAYRQTYKNNGEDAARLTLTINSIDPDAEDNNALSVAYAIVDMATSSDWSQGGTSETLPESARANLLKKADGIFKSAGVVNPLREQNSEIDGSTVW